MNFFVDLMAPLGKEHCMILYYIGLLNFFFALIALITGFTSLFDKKTRDRGGLLIMNSVVLFIMYYLYRIVYSMCVKSM